VDGRYRPIILSRPLERSFRNSFSGHGSAALLLEQPIQEGSHLCRFRTKSLGDSGHELKIHAVLLLRPRLTPSAAEDIAQPSIYMTVVIRLL